MFIDMILNHIPRTWKAGVALAVMIIAFPIGLSGLTNVLVGPSGMDWLRCVGGIVVGTGAAIFFYREQEASTHMKTASDVQAETLNAYERDLRVKQAAKEMKSWNMNDGDRPKD